MPQERVTPAEQETEKKRIAQIEREAREASLARREAELAEARLNDPWPIAPTYGRNTTVSLDVPTLVLDKTGAVLAGMTPEGKATTIKTDAEGYALTRLHPNDLATLRSIVRIARSRNRAAEDLDHVAALARELLRRYGVDE